MAEYVLHCFAQSGNAYKPALMLQLCGADWEARWVDFFNGVGRSPEFRDNVNEMGEIPVLDHGSIRMTQSGVMLDYLVGKLGKFGWKNEEERREIFRWILFDNHKFTANIASLRFLRNFAKTGETPITEFLEGRVKGAFSITDKHLATRSFMVGDRPTIADFSMCGYLYWPEEIGMDFSAYPNMNRWIQSIRDLPGWVHPYELMPGHPLPAKA